MKRWMNEWKCETTSRKSKHTADEQFYLMHRNESTSMYLYYHNPTLIGHMALSYGFTNLPCATIKFIM